MIEKLKKLSISEKIEVFEWLRDDLKLKTITEFNRSIGRSYGSKIDKNIKRIIIGKTLYFVDNGQNRS